MSERKSDSIMFEGEEAGSGLASPLLDLGAAAFLILLSIIVMIASLMLPVPGDVQTAPGLLPFLTAASLLAMALALGISAFKRLKAGVGTAEPLFEDEDQGRRTMLLAAMVAVYIAALQTLAFQIYFTIAGVTLVLSAFEPVTMIALAVIMHHAWRGPLWIIALIAIGWTLTLSLLFQKVFRLPLPGGF